MLSIPVSMCTTPGWTEWICVFLIFGAATAAPVLVLRLAGMRMVCADTPPPLPEQVASLRRWQFSLGTMFTLTTGVAILLGVMRWPTFPWAFAVIVLAMCGSFALSAVLALWAMFARRWIIVRVLVLVVVCPAIGAAVGILERDPEIYGLVAGAETAYIAAAALVLRISGFRPTWNPDAPTPSNA